MRRLAGEAAATPHPEAAYGAAYARSVRPLLAVRDAATCLRDRVPTEALLAGPLGGVTLRHYLGAGG